MIVIQLYNLDKTFKYANKKAIYKIYNKISCNIPINQAKAI